MKSVTPKTIMGIFIAIGLIVLIPAVLMPNGIITIISLFSAGLVILLGISANYFKSKFLRLIMNCFFVILFSCWSYRAWYYLFGFSLYQLIIFIGVIAIFGITPIISPKIAKFLHMEIYFPKTRLGIVINRLLLIFGYGMLSIGTVLGLNMKTEVVENRIVLWIMFVAMYIVALLYLFLTVYEYVFVGSSRFEKWGLWKSK